MFVAMKRIVFVVLSDHITLCSCHFAELLF